jgi:hypothetical protein
MDFLSTNFDFKSFKNGFSCRNFDFKSFKNGFSSRNFDFKSFKNDFSSRETTSCLFKAIPAQGNGLKTIFENPLFGLKTFPPKNFENPLFGIWLYNRVKWIFLQEFRFYNLVKWIFLQGISILQPCSWFSFAEIGLSDFVRFPFRKKGMKNFYLFADR